MQDIRYVSVLRMQDVGFRQDVRCKFENLTMNDVSFRTYRFKFCRMLRKLTALKYLSQLMSGGCYRICSKQNKWFKLMKIRK